VSEPSTLLGIYLNDHLAGATGGLALFRRATSSAQGASKAELAELTQQVTQDRQSLLALMHRLGVPVRHYKVATGWALEKAGRLKTNGHLLHRSPLSDLVELEALVLGVQGKAAGFRALRSIAQHDPRFDVTDLDRLIDRAERQAQKLEELRLHAAARALTGPDHAPTGGHTTTGS